MFEEKTKLTGAGIEITLQPRLKHTIKATQPQLSPIIPITKGTKDHLPRVSYYHTPDCVEFECSYNPGCAYAILLHMACLTPCIIIPIIHTVRYI